MPFIVIYNKEKVNAYFTVERSSVPHPKVKPSFFLCSWDKEGNHDNYGQFKSPELAVKEFMKVLEKYK